MYYYSLWGIASGIIALLTSIIATHCEGWYKIAYISNELALGINSVVVPMFWLVLWPGMIKGYRDYEKQHPEAKK